MVAGERDPDRSAGLGLQAMLDLLAQTIVNALGFDAAAINLVESEDRVVVVAVAGPPEVREQLLGTTVDLSSWERLLDTGQAWGRLVFLGHQASEAAGEIEMVSWTPDTAVSDDPEAWHPQDSLFAPLRGTDGVLLGVLSVDLPRGGRRPDKDTRRSLEAFGVSAALAIEHATLRARAEQSEELFREVFSASPLGMALMDDQDAIVVGNQALCRFLERTPSELTGRHLSDFRHPDDSRRAADKSGQIPLESGGEAERFVRTDGSVVYGEVTQALLHGGARVVTQIRDVTEQRAAVSRLEHLATHDVATGVGNRSLLLQRLRAAIAQQQHSGDTIALLFIDLDGFKGVNDEFSHAVGDHVLRTVAQRLLASVRPGDSVVRWGGDEFVVMLHPLPHAHVALELAERIGTALSAPVAIGADEASITSSIGVAYSTPADDLDVDALLRRADTAMYTAKRESNNSFAVFDAELEGSLGRQSHTEQLVRSALEYDRVVLQYQPIVELSNGAVTGVEALMRLRDDDGRLLYPASFLAIAARTGDVQAMDIEALRQACRDVAHLSGNGSPLRLAVNVCPAQLERGVEYVLDVSDALADAGLSGTQLTLEVSERALDSVTRRSRDTMNRLAELGLSFSVDDFGMGQRSWTYLRTLPVSEIKIDRQLIHQCPDDRVSSAMLRAYATLAHEMGLNCVAMGVETREQHDAVVSRGIARAQGFLYEQPVRVEALADFLRRNRENAPSRAGQQPQ